MKEILCLLIGKYEREFFVYQYVVDWGCLVWLISFFYLLADHALRSLNWKINKWEVFIFIASKEVGDQKII